MARKENEVQIGFINVADFSESETTAIPIAVFLMPDATKLDIASISINDGVLSIEVEPAE